MLQQQPLMPPLSEDDDLSAAAEGGDLRLQSYLKECPPPHDLGGQPLQGEPSVTYDSVNNHAHSAHLGYYVGIFSLIQGDSGGRIPGLG